MKLLAMGIAFVACLPVFPQTPGQAFTMFRTRAGFRVVVDDGRTLEATAKTAEALKPSIPPFVVRFKGDVEITINGMELRADQVDYHWNTGEFEASGNVHVKPVTP